jgi:hypothetical protein
MVDVAHWRLQEDPRPKAISKLAFFMANYSESRVKREHDLHCTRALRERTDGLRTFADLPPPQSRPSRGPYMTAARAYHRIKGQSGRIA